MIEPKVDPSRVDVKSLGLRAGLEIHQQLNTSRKLFCGCPTRLAGDNEPRDEFVRQLRPTRSELGEVDIAALFEWRKGRMYHYHAPRSVSCLVEADEEPPHEMNREAVAIGLAMALAFGSTIIDEIYVMRKIVIDGSNTSGFQRTAIVALGGSVGLPSGKKIGIQSIAIEEDAARKIKEEGRFVHYNLDRLGIPLIEISTAPDIESPEEAYEAALTIGQMLRLTGKVKRGIGTIRQDLNVSIKGGVKTEIKGVQRLDLLPRIVLYEAIRQHRLLQIRDELRSRGLDEEKVRNEAEIVDVSDIFQGTKSKIIARTLRRGGRVLAAKLYGYHGLLGVEVEPGRRFGTELADYARFWGGVGGIFHSDELPAYGITEEELTRVYTALGAVKGRDAVVIVADDERKARKALEAVIDRAVYALRGIPRETRAALEDGTTRFMRPQPGSARMYPETDIPPLEVDDELLREAASLKPMTPGEKLSELKRKYRLSDDLAGQLLRSQYLSLFEELAIRYPNVPPSFIASLLTNILKSLAREGVPIDNIDERRIEEVVAAVAEGKISKDAVPDVLEHLAKNPGEGVEDAIKALGIESLSLEAVERLVEEAVRSLEGEIREKGMRALGKVMGRVMPVLRGRVDGKVVAEIARRKIQEVLRTGEDGNNA